MKKSLFFLLAFGLVGASSVQAKNYYVATTGSDATGTGALAAPYASMIKAQQSVVAGDTVFVRGGTYTMSESQISQTFPNGPYAVVHYLNKSGASATKRICYWAYPGEQPIFDMSNVKPAGYRNTVFYVTGSWLHIKGLEVIGTQVTIAAHTQSECFRNEGSNNIYEQLKMHDGMAIGFYLTRGGNNLVLNCDAYRNYDSFSESGAGGNTDGFGFHPAKGGSGNVIRGCRAWFNSDDGYDCINSAEGTLFENCWAFYNGYNAAFTKIADGNGFKVGGYGKAPALSSLPNPIPANTVRFCMAYRNKSNGFYANHHVETGSYWYNNTAYRNSTNYNMLSQRMTKSPTTGADTTIDCPGIRHILRNNISFKYSNLKDTVNLGTSENTYNSFSPGIGVAVASSDFLSAEESLLIAERKADGSLPDMDFLKLAKGSDLIDKGVNLGFSYFGVAPDLGAFESNYATSAIEAAQKDELLSFYPNPVKEVGYMTVGALSGEMKIELMDRVGVVVSSQQVDAQAGRQGINMGNLNSGVYFVKITSEGKSFLRKVIKL